MKAFFIPAVVAVGLLVSGPVEAKPAGCSLVVAKRDIFSGTCDFSSHNDGTGSFVLTSPTGHFVYVNIYPEEALGYWNGLAKASHAHEDLGTLTRETSDPACWSNGYARVCAR